MPSVPESLLKKRQAYAVMKAKRQKKILAIKKVNILWSSDSDCLFAGVAAATTDVVQYRSSRYAGVFLMFWTKMCF